MEHIGSADAGPWWERRRLRYNVGLIVAGVLAFVAYVGVVERAISQGTMPCAEITLFTIVFQGIGYLVMMGIANLCYNLGPWLESFIRPAGIEKYRRFAYWMGFSFSVLLPFAVPAFVAWSPLIHPGSVPNCEP